MATLASPNQYHLVGCYTRYSSWTARVVTLLEYYSIPYHATYFNLSPSSKIELKKVSPNGLVPVLIDPSLNPGIRINDSLAICEYLAESHPDLPLWPMDRELRAMARSATAEMHAGFSAVRNEFTANFVARYEGNIPISDQATREVERILKLWDECRRATIAKLQSGTLGKEDKGFLFGEFGIVDAFYWPILWRFRSYQLPLTTATPATIEYLKTMWSDPIMKKLGSDCFFQAQNPETNIENYNDVYKGREDISCGVFDEAWEFHSE